MRRSRAFAVTTAALAATLLLGACGGGSKSATTTSAATTTLGVGLGAADWIGQLCTFGLTVDRAIEDRSNELANSTPATLEEAKQSFLDLMTFTISQLGSFEDETGKLGTPAVDGGAAAVDKMRAQFEQAKAVFQKAITQVQAVPTVDPTAFDKAMTDISNQLDNSSAFGSSDHLEFGQTDLDAAYAANADCQALENGGSSPSPSSSPSP